MGSPEDGEASRPLIQAVHLNFSEGRPIPGRKTLSFTVSSAYGSPITGSPLGYIEWYAPWRKYCFFPEPSTLYDPSCLNTIAFFASERTREHYEAIKAAKAAG